MLLAKPAKSHPLPPFGTIGPRDPECVTPLIKSLLRRRKRLRLLVWGGFVSIEDKHNKNSSGDEIANVNFYTTISHTYFEITKKRTYFV